jgi:hypothetical protein
MSASMQACPDRATQSSSAVRSSQKATKVHFGYPPTRKLDRIRRTRRRSIFKQGMTPLAFPNCSAAQLRAEVALYQDRRV